MVARGLPVTRYATTVSSVENLGERNPPSRHDVAAVELIPAAGAQHSRWVGGKSAQLFDCFLLWIDQPDERYASAQVQVDLGANIRLPVVWRANLDNHVRNDPQIARSGSGWRQPVVTYE